MPTWIAAWGAAIAATLTLAPAALAAPVLQNASLEQDADGNGVPDCWELAGTGTSSYSAARTTDSHTGTYAERIAITAYTNGSRKLIVRRTTGCMPQVTPSRAYRLSAWYKSNVQPYFAVYWRDASNQLITSSTGPRLPASSSWRQGTWTTPLAPANARYVSFGVALAGVGSLTVDDHGIVENTNLLLPDLVQQPPLELGVDQSTGSYRLGFNSASENYGDGPLILEGHRPNTSSTMVVDQRIKLQGSSSTQLRPGIGTMIFYTPHNHWHYIPYMDYELRRPSDYSLVAPDQKQGFCLGDRYTPGSGDTRIYPPNPPGPYTGEGCQAGKTQALAVDEGMSVGYGDEYVPQLEGQYIDITGVAAGDYTLVHRLNTDRSLLEKSYTNDAASALIRLWPNGYGNWPAVQRLKTCRTSDHCTASASAASSEPATSPAAPARVQRAGPEPTFQGGLPLPEEDPPLLVPRAARYFATKALRKGLRGFRARRAGCKRDSRRVFTCRVRARRAGRAYRGSVRIALPRANDQRWWTYRVRLRAPGGVHRLRSARVRVKRL